MLGYLLSTREIIRIQGQLVSAQKIDALLSRLDVFFEKNLFLTPADFKEITTLSRKYAIPILEWLDQQGHTLRVGDKRKKRETSWDLPLKYDFDSL